ncbi:expressed unknown protein [Seminavis robusta]|uniref:Uncharacterized protein n=1 Tax=Seminavis robusta TaxID=568900 RepID=A0A9N8EWF2_9STRA|nr:expressed unknown protein [Seminavis robusta]|eukprot:Sro2498_g329371.1  (217) ;mRNA; r:9769-10419
MESSNLVIPGMDFGHRYANRLSRGHHKTMYSAPKKFAHSVLCAMVVAYESTKPSKAMASAIAIFNDNAEDMLYSMNADPQDRAKICESFRKKIPLLTYFLDENNEHPGMRSEQGVVLLEKKTNRVLPIRENIPKLVEPYKPWIREQLASKKKPESLATQKGVESLRALGMYGARRLLQPCRNPTCITHVSLYTFARTDVMRAGCTRTGEHPHPGLR